MKMAAADRAALLSILDRFSDQRVVLVGDLVADEFVYGEIARVSREAPVLILKQREKQIVPGGGANAANNLAELGRPSHARGDCRRRRGGRSTAAIFPRERCPDAPHPSLARPHYPHEIAHPGRTRRTGSASKSSVWIESPFNPRAAPSPATEPESVRPCCLGVRLLVSDYGYGSTDAHEVEFLRRRVGRRTLPITVDSRYRPVELFPR